MPALTIGAYKLPAAEVILIKTLIRLFGHSPDFKWRFADTGPFDAVLIDETVAPAPASLARAVLTITGAGTAPRPNAIARPIRAEQLQAWLQQQAEALRTTPRLQRSEPSCAPSRSGLRFKLRRWPSAALLANDPLRIRLATLLSRRALGTRELSSISRLPPEQCQAFVDTLRAAGLIEVQQVSRRPDAARPPHAATTTAPVSLGLIASLRRRLGL